MLLRQVRKLINNIIENPEKIFPIYDWEDIRYCF